MVYEEKVLSGYDIQPLQAVGWEGILYLYEYSCSYNIYYLSTFYNMYVYVSPHKHSNFSYHIKTCYCICKARRKSLSDTEMPQAKANSLKYFLFIECFSRNKHKH